MAAQQRPAARPAAAAPARPAARPAAAPARQAAAPARQPAAPARQAAPKPTPAPQPAARRAAPAAPAAPARAAARTPAAPAAAPARGPAPAAGGGNAAQVAKMLKQMKTRFQQAKEESAKGGAGGGGTTAAPGRHECRLTDARIITNPNLAVVFDFTVVSGDETGEKCVRFDGLDTDDRIVWFQRDLRRLGIPMDDLDIEQLPELCEQLKEAAPLVRITVKEKDGYLNAYIDKVLEMGEGDPGEGAAAPTEDDPAPTDDTEAAVEAEADPGEAPAEDVAELALGDPVAYTDAEGVEQTGVVEQIYDDDSSDVKDDKTGQVVAVPNAGLIKLVAADE